MSATCSDSVNFRHFQLLTKETMNAPKGFSNLRFTKIPLNSGTGVIPALGFGTLIPDPVATKTATTSALEVGFRHLDCAERYKNEREWVNRCGTAFASGALAREDVFITRSCGIPTIGPSGLNQHTMRVANARG